MTRFRYQDIAALLIRRIEQGIYPTHQKLPSIRTLSQELGVSKGSIVRCYEFLEDERHVVAVEKSGFYPAQARYIQNTLQTLSPQQKEALQPHCVDNKSLGIHIVRSATHSNQIALGSANPCVSFPGVKRFYQLLQKQVRCELNELDNGQLSHYQAPPGDPLLCQQISFLMAEKEIHIPEEQVLITNGTQSAITLALQNTTKEGDIVLIQSPCFYGILQCLEALNRKVIEVPQDKMGGPDTRILASVLSEARQQNWPVKAILVQPTVHNPTGLSMPLCRRKELIRLANQYDLAVIEDDVFADLSLQSPLLLPIKALDTENRVLYCSSVSKTLTPKIRIGWLLAGRWHDQCQHFQFVSKMGLPGHTQHAVGLWLETGQFKRHLRQIRRQYQQRQTLFHQAIDQFWPDDITCQKADGGFLAWIQLPDQQSSLALYQWAQQRGINTTPGPLFSSQGKYQDFIRLNYALFQGQPDYISAIRQLGERIKTNSKRD